MPGAGTGPGPGRPRRFPGRGADGARARAVAASALRAAGSRPWGPGPVRTQVGQVAGGGPDGPDVRNVSGGWQRPSQQSCAPRCAAVIRGPWWRR